MPPELLYYNICCFSVLCGLCPCGSGDIPHNFKEILTFDSSQFVLVNVVVAVLMKHLEESHKQVCVR